MLERNIRQFILLCLFAFAISGSPRFQGWDKNTRLLRHASCPSCRRERPDALVSWDTSSGREYRELEPETSPWQVAQQFRPNPTFYPSPYSSPYNTPYNNPYNRAARSRGTPTRSGSTCKRENPFTVGRDVDFDVAPAQTAPVHSLIDQVPPYQPHFPVPRSPTRTSYRKPSFYDLIKGQPDLTPVNRYTDYSLVNNEPSFDTARRPTSPYEDSNKNFNVIHRGDKYLDDSFEEENPMMQPVQYNRGQVSYGRSPTMLRMQERNQFLPFRRDQIEEPRVIYTSQVKHSSYKPSPGSNVFKMTQSVGKQDEEVVNDNRWQHRFEEQEKEEPEVSRDFKADEDGDQMETRMTEEMNDGHQGSGHFDFVEEEQQEEVKGKRDAVEEDTSSGEFSSETQLEVKKITEPEVYVEGTTKTIIMA